MRTNKLLQYLFILLIIAVSADKAYSQLITASTIREDVEIFTPLQNPTVIGEGDDPWQLVPMPFTFNYDNSGVNNLYVYGNGFISINTQRSPFGSSVPTFGGTPDIIYFYGRDLVTGGNLSYKVTGTAPFRILTIEQLGARVSTDNTGAYFDVQVKFFETTNEIKIIYGNISGIGGNGIDGWVGFVGSSTSRYINIEPKNPLNPSIFHYSDVNPNLQPWLKSATRQNLPNGKSYTLSGLPTLQEVYPNPSVVLARSNVYADTLRPYVRINRADGQANIGVKYKITGPIGDPSPITLYTGIDQADINASDTVKPVPQPVGTGIRLFMPHARDLGGRLSDGALDLLTNKDVIKPGEYSVAASLVRTDGVPYSFDINTKFTIAFDNDVAATQINAPIPDNLSIYSHGGPIPVNIRIKNQGATPVKSITITYSYYDLATNQLKGTYTFDPTGLDTNPLLFNEYRDFELTRLPNNIEVGRYYIVFNVHLNADKFDDLPDNNVIPRSTDPRWIFQVGYETEAQSAKVITPASTVYLNRPFRPMVEFKNNGVSDISDSPANITILDPDQVDVYNVDYVVQDIPRGIINFTDVVWPDMFTPVKIGTYTMTVTINANGDANNTNDKLTYRFSVIGGMSGTYSISSQSGSDFKTIDAAVTALYDRGVVGPVKFLLKDAVYNVGNENFFAPALDLSSTIIGVNSTNTITFTIDPVNSNYASTKINLRTASGVGVYIAQNNLPNHANAAVRNVVPSASKLYANSNGYITFDGGSKKSFLFTLYTASPFRAVFYLGNGASNDQISNCVIQDGINQPSVYNCTLPLTSFDAALNKFSYQTDNNPDGTYSTGVLLRSIMPSGPITDANDYGLDILVNNSNNIYNNEIKGFGYGVVSLGIGALYLEDFQDFSSFYNTANHIENNDISQIGSAGIFLGYEKGSYIEGNRIYNILGNCGSSSAGILLGGQGRSTYYGYSDINCTITANEISDVEGSQNLYGIRIVQEKTRFVNSDANYTIPDANESSILINNLIWGFKPQNATTNIFGISLTTERSAATNWATQTITPKITDYFTRNDLISNNTIILNNDQIENTGVVIGVDVENVQNAKMINNAIGISDPSINPSSPVSAAVFYYGLHPTKNGLAADRNAYWFDPSKSAIYRFIETDANSKVLEQGSKFEFITLDQWRPWSRQDTNSVFGDFVSDHQLVGVAPYKMRISSSPYPLGSILNNRGSNIVGNERDIDGNPRGIAGEMYDIGAIEFRGRTYSRDLEILNISAPAAYQATAPAPFSDAIYIMTQAPITVQGIIRNNGSFPASAINATFTAYRQLPSGAWQQVYQALAPIKDLLSYENGLLDFHTNVPPNMFIPQTYSDLVTSGYTVPVQYRSMIPNVTPLYKLVIQVPNDEHNANNVWEKVVRFYLKRSGLSILISGQNLGSITPASTLDSIASRLNVDSIAAGFNHLGWFIDYGGEQPSYDFDMFDRKAWEPRSVDYTIYRSLFWADGIDTLPGNQLSLLTRYDKDDLNNFLNAGTFADKKNLVISSQEMYSNESTVSPSFVRNLLNVKYAVPFNPLGAGVSYAGHLVKGVYLYRDNDGYLKIDATQYPGDSQPYAGLFDMDNPGIGVSYIGFKYVDHFQDDFTDPLRPIIVKDEKRINTLVTTYPLYNKVYSAVDWRHWSNIEYYMRAVITYLNSANGNVVPINLLTFDATPTGKRVDLSWSTASESNSSHFEIERADIIKGYKSNYSLLGRMDAAGNSNITKEYGPYTDFNVQYGNTYSYRLKMVDRDGEFAYSDEKVLTINGAGGNMKLETVNPNPVNGTSQISANFDRDMNVKLYIIDESGREAATIFNGNVKAGSRIFEINSSELSNGSYTIVLTNGSDNVTTGMTVVK